jgi:hypothetical protein
MSAAAKRRAQEFSRCEQKFGELLECGGVKCPFVQVEFMKGKRGSSRGWRQWVGLYQKCVRVMINAEGLSGRGFSLSGSCVSVKRARDEDVLLQGRFANGQNLRRHYRCQACKLSVSAWRRLQWKEDEGNVRLSRTEASDVPKHFADLQE